MTTLHRPAQDYGLSLILGGAEGSLWEITTIYAGLARSVNQHLNPGGPGGPFSPPEFLWSPENPVEKGRLFRTAPLGAASCYEALMAMLEVTRPGAENAWQAFVSSRKIAWKTGTSFGYRDGWAVGVTPRHAVGVWAGNADGEGRPGLTGYWAAAPVLFALFNMLDTGLWFEPPRREMIEIEVCAKSGMRKGPSCAGTKKILIPRAAGATSVCPYCRLVFCDARGEWRVHGDCEPVAAMNTVPWFVLPPAMEWYYKRAHSDYRPLPPFRRDCRESMAAVATRSLSCIYPEPKSQIYVPLELDGSRGKTVFEAAHRQPQTRIFWHLDGNYLGETEHIHQMAVAPDPGEHVLTLVDEHGDLLQRWFTVLDKERTVPDPRPPR
jgi:penicillin-binding protein 1C